MEINIASLKEKYNSPVTALSGLNDGCSYCVGGALILGLLETKEQSIYKIAMRLSDSIRRFPDNESLGEIIRAANPKLSSQHAFNFAEIVTGANDEDKFEEAWQLLSLALTEDTFDFSKLKKIYNPDWA